MVKHILMGILAFTILFGCNDKGDPFKENSEIQSEENIKAKNKDIEAWSSKLQVDIDDRRRFIDAISGEYQGSYISKLELPKTFTQPKTNKYWIKIIVSPVLPDFQPDRTRTVKELEAELMQLKLNVQVLQWMDGMPYGASGCNYEGILPDYKKGTIELFSKMCGATYKIAVASDRQMAMSATTLSHEIMKSEQSDINVLKGEFQSNSYASKNKFSVTRIK